MLKSIVAPIAAACTLLVLLPAATAEAQGARSWVDGMGDDSNPCSRSAPCKTFAGAQSRTSASGEISVLRPGGFGAVTINKSLSIVSDGAEASILANGTAAGIVVNAAATDVVTISGIYLEGGGSGTRGIRIVSAKSVHIRDCIIRNFNGNPGVALEIVPTAADVNVFISNCTIEDTQNGVVATPTGTGINANVFLDRVRISKLAVGSGLGVAVSANPNSVIWINRSDITNTTSAFQKAGNGNIISFVNNAVAGNTGNENPTNTTPLK